MELPVELKLAIENQLVGIKHARLMEDAQILSKKYRNESGHGKRLLTENNEAVDKLWNSANKVVSIIEPGTPVGYSHLRKIREYLLDKGAHIAAPCPHENSCQLKEDDWCHFTCRVQRSKLHRQLKEGEVPYEDEKFAYLAITREKYRNADARILRHPIIAKGRITLETCSMDGVKKVNVFKRDGDLYKKARKAQCGDEISIK